jgi:hypothetical protein
VRSFPERSLKVSAQKNSGSDSEPESSEQICDWQLSLWCSAGTVSVGHGGLLLGDTRALWSHFGIQFLVGSPFRWKIVFVENRSDRALRHTCFAVNAFIRMNEQDGFTFVEALHWTNDHAVSVFAVEAWLGDDMSH